MSQTRRAWLGVLPIPALVALIAVLAKDIDPSLFYDPPWLILVGNSLFVTAICLAVAAVALTHFLATGRPQILLLGSGVLTMGVGAAAAAAVRGLPDGANLNVTIYNSAALMAALFHFCAAFLVVAGSAREARPRARPAWLAAAYGGSLALVLLVTAAALAGWTPPFKPAGALGFTPMRQVVLGAADALFTCSAVMLMAEYLRAREVFLYWYACALGLTAVSLAAFFVQASVGSLVGWTGRASQYLGGIYFLVALLRATRSARSRQVGLADVLAASLSGSEEKFRALAENSPDAIRRFDRGLMHLYANPACRKLYGLPPSAVIGKTIDQVGLDVSRASEWAGRIREVFRTGLRSETEEEYAAEGGTRYLQSFCVSESGRDGSVANVLVLSRDLTDRRVAERELASSEERFRLVFQGMQESFLVQEVIRGDDGRLADLRYVEVNPVAERQLGRSRADIVGRLRSEVLGPLDPQAQEFVENALAGGAPAQLERWEAHTGRWFQVISYSPRPGQLVTLNVDITERKLAEERLRTTSRRLETLSHVAAELLVETDPQKALERLAHRVMGVLDCHAFFNFLLAAEQHRLRLNAYAGISSEEAAQIEWLDAGTSICGRVALEGRRIVAENIQGTDDPLPRLVRGYGIRAYACHPLLGTGGEVIGTLSFGTRTRDRFDAEDLAYMKTVTDHIAIAIERHRTEVDRTRLNETLEQRVAERTAEATQLTHQLRSLAAELAQAEQRERKRLATVLHDHIQQLIVAARLRVEKIDPRGDPEAAASSLAALRGLLEETLDASRNLTVEISPPILKQGGLVAALRWLGERMAEKHQFDVELQLDPEAEPEREEARFLLFECARELLFNSLKHSGKRKARLEASHGPGPRIRVVVQDGGKGFERGRQAAGQRGVTAFGLFSIEQRLAGLGGSMEIDSTAGKGSRISIEVPAGASVSRPFEEAPSPMPFSAPAAPAAPAPPPRAVADRGACRGGAIRVLMVDDNRNLREGLSELLGLEEDIEVVGGAANGPEAIEMARRLRPDVIAMDLNLGGMDGIEATRIILRSDPSAKIIGLSMYTEADVAQSMRDAGAAAYVAKGGPTRLLAEAIRACARGS